MLDIGWTELLVIGVVALIVVGPKDLPMMFRTLGRFTGRLRTMARDFSRAMDDAANESGARDIARDLRTMSNPTRAGSDALKKATGLDKLNPFDDDAAGDDAADGAGKANASAPRGPNTQALAEARAADAKKLREEAVARANARAAEGFSPDAPAEKAPPASPSAQASASAEPAGPSDAAPAHAAAQDERQDRA